MPANKITKEKRGAAAKAKARDAVQTALALLKSEGLRITPQREDILHLLARRKGSHSVQAVFQEIRKKHRAISLDTVYRTLSTLANLGVLSQIKLHGADLVYEFQGAGHHHHHAVCLDCGASTCLKVCPLPENFFQDLESQDFRVVNHAFEVYGYCAKCK
ncbi:MAG: Fur family transcriptional regulator [Leptospirales bacterium]|jgi:Fur family zinc uptake transcriptional regulator